MRAGRRSSKGIFCAIGLRRAEFRRGHRAHGTAPFAIPKVLPIRAASAQAPAVEDREAEAAGHGKALAVRQRAEISHLMVTAQCRARRASIDEAFGPAAPRTGCAPSGPSAASARRGHGRIAPHRHRRRCGRRSRRPSICGLFSRASIDMSLAMSIAPRAGRLCGIEPGRDHRGPQHVDFEPGQRARGEHVVGARRDEHVLVGLFRHAFRRGDRGFFFVPM